MRIVFLITIILALVSATTAGCRKVAPEGGDGDSGPDTDTDSDTDTDTDSDTDTDTDSDTDSDSGWDTDDYPVGDCQTDEDCPQGTCEPVPDEPGGYLTCIAPPSPVDGPSGSPQMDECENSTECLPGCGCFLVTTYWGPTAVYNRCVCPECDDDADCSDPVNQICIPAGAWGEPMSRCVYAECKVHSNCTWTSGGYCIPHTDPCGPPDPPILMGKFCHYDDDPCWEDDDCPDDFQACAPGWDGMGFNCEELVCPL